ncbi:MAG: hypothetical protein RL748_350 [Pseudomonadota bacterium]|jgi:hypothetical protein
MLAQRKNLPIGIETFSEIISKGCYYVDKTHFARQLLQHGKYFFLSRPRRFGKSLFLTTLRELFEGNQVLFRGLSIHDQWDWNQTNPVVSISFGEGVLASRAALDEKIREILQDNQERLGIQCSHSSISGQFSQLLRLAHKKFGRAVAVLIDEYDKPILDNITDPGTALAMREGLKNFYSVIKSADADIHFAFMTGVSKFSKVSLFSGLNNLNDITLDSRYSALCGYTDDDVDSVFAAELPGLEREQIRRWYNGYHWLGQAVYNPFDLLLLFDKRKFNPYWFESATPAFLIKLLTEREAWLPTLDKTVADADLLAAFDVEEISTTALMFQAGYLTIERELQVAGRYYYQLRFPNHEVRQSLYGGLLRVWTGNPDAGVQHKMDLPAILAAGDMHALQSLLQAFFSSIPYNWHVNNPIANYEGYYASVFYAWFSASGLDVIAEDVTSKGRIDLALQLPERIYLFEFKLSGLAPGQALQQLKDKAYADKYRAAGVPIYLIGIEFSREQRNVRLFESEILTPLT